MQSNSVGKIVPLIVFLALFGGLAVYYGPGMLELQRFNSTLGSFLGDARAGNLGALSGYVDPAQQQMVGDLLMGVPADYHQHIEKLSSGNLDRSGDNMWVIVSARLENGVYQANLKWTLKDGKWVWDPFGSYFAPLSLSGEPEWKTLQEAIAEYTGM